MTISLNNKVSLSGLYLYYFISDIVEKRSKFIYIS